MLRWAQFPRWARPLLAFAFVLVILPVELRAARGTGPGGYSWRDCLEVDGPPCDYVIEAFSDNLTGLCSDEIFNPPAGAFGMFNFPFEFYGAPYTEFWVSSNGVVYLSNPPTNDAANAALDGTEGRTILAPFWDDWAMDNDDFLNAICPIDPECSNTGPLTMVESYRRGAGLDGTLEYYDFEWFDTAHHRPFCTETLVGGQATFGMRVYEDGRILLNYFDTDVSFPDVDHGASATIGVSSGVAGEFTQVAFDTASIPFNPYAILIIPPCRALTCDSMAVIRDSACEGEIITLRAEHSGGVGNVTFEWDFDGDTTTDATGNPVMQVLPPGTTTVTYTATDECSEPGPQSCSFSEDVTVIPAPMPDVMALGSTSFCAMSGESVTLGTAAGFVSYQWNLDGAPIPGATNQTLVANQTGAYTVTVTDMNGCTGTSSGILVNADDCMTSCPDLTCIGVVIGPAIVCEGESNGFTAVFSGGEGAVTVAWDLDGDTIGDVTGRSVDVMLPAGMPTVTMIVTDSCADPAPQLCTFEATPTIHPNPSPGVTPGGPTSFCAASGEDVVLTADAGFASYQWQLDGGDLVGETDAMLTATATGSYVVVVTDANGCSGASDPVLVDAETCVACAQLNCLDAIANPGRACEGESQTFSAFFSGGEGAVTVTWDLDGDTVTDMTGETFSTTLPPGSPTVVATITDSCLDPGAQSCTLDVTPVIVPTPVPVITPDGPTSFCAMRGERVTLRTEDVFTTYQWQVDGMDVVGADGLQLVVLNSGTYTVIVTDGDGCVGTSAPLVINAEQCSCPPLACSGIMVAPSPDECSGVEQTFTVGTTGGDGTLSYEWDLDGDTTADETGNPLATTLPMGSWSVSVTVTDECGTPQTCSTSVIVMLEPGPGDIGEVSPRAGLPLFVDPAGASITVESNPGAVVYNVHSDVLGSWYAPAVARGTQCSIDTWTDLGGGRIRLDHALATGAWIVVTGSNPCGEGPAGQNSIAQERTTQGTWELCGPSP